MFKKICNWLLGRQLDYDAYYQARYAGWLAHETLMISKIKHHYPDQAKEMMDKLLA